MLTELLSPRFASDPLALPAAGRVQQASFASSPSDRACFRIKTVTLQVESGEVLPDWQLTEMFHQDWARRCALSRAQLKKWCLRAGKWFAKHLPHLTWDDALPPICSFYSYGDRAATGEPEPSSCFSNLTTPFRHCNPGPSSINFAPNPSAYPPRACGGRVPLPAGSGSAGQCAPAMLIAPKVTANIRNAQHYN